MSLFTIDADVCRRDGICVAECPMSIIELRDEARVPGPVPGAAERCIDCGHCVAACPHGAFSHRAMAAADCPPVRDDMAFTTAQVEHLLRSRRSVRVYRRDEVAPGRLESLIRVARYSPTATNAQRVAWVVFSGRERVRGIAELVIERLRVLLAEGHPLAGPYRFERMIAAWDAGTDPVCRDAPALVAVHAPRDYPPSAVDCASALAYFDVAAPSFGLGACWAGYLMLALLLCPALALELDLPEGHACFGIMMVGYPKHAYRRLPLRAEPRISWR
jgi:nitroreductase/NAD-dependent dihydropyrimidine dehydrogenase PreA subunit